MYRTCIFCSADLGANQAIKEFPVGRALAFDAWGSLVGGLRPVPAVEPGAHRVEMLR